MNFRISNIDRLFFDLEPTQSEATLFSKVIATSAILVLIYFTCFWKLGVESFSNLDEALHVSVVQETSDWLNPRLRGKPYLNKPPLKMMLTEIPLEIFGDKKISYRLIDALSGGFSIALTALVAFILFGSISISFFSAAILLGSRAFIHEHSVRLALQDSFMTLLLLLSLLQFWRFLKESSLRNSIILGVIIGLAGLTKSIAGLVPLPIFLAYLFYDRYFLTKSPEFELLEKTKKIVLAGVISVLMLLCYYVPHFIFTPFAFDIVFRQEILDRVVTGYHNVSDPYFYIKAFFNGDYIDPYLALAGLLLSFIVVLKRRDERVAILLFWFLGFFSLYHLSTSKLMHYVNPGLPALSILAAVFLNAIYLRIREIGSIDSSRFQAVFYSLLFVVLSYFVATDIYGVVKESKRSKTKHQADKLVGKLRDSKTKIVHVGSLDLGFFEKPYFRMLGEDYFRDKELRVENIDIRKYGVIIAPAKLDYEIFNKHPVQSFRYFPPPPPVIPKPPFFERKSWLFIASLVEADSLPLTPVKKVVKFAAKDFRQINGFEGIAKFGDLVTRHSKSHKSIFVVPGDGAFKKFGAKASINLAVAPGDSLGELSLYLNSELVHRLIPIAAGLNTYEFQIPPGSMVSGDNVFMVQAGRAGDKKRQIFYNWLSLRLNMEAA